MNLVLAFFTTALSLATQDPSSLTLEPLKPQSGDPSGCSCTFGDGTYEFGSPEKIFILNEGALNHPIHVQVDGKRRLLESITVKSDEIDWPQTQVGKKFTRVYRSPSLEITLRYKVVRVCSKSQPECESVGYEVDADLRSGGRAGKKLGMRGRCAC
jgi:hypothetical protein